METKIANGGVDRSYGNSSVQKWVFILGHLSVIVFCIWLIFFDGLHSLGALFGKEWSFADLTRAKILFLVALVYWIRHIVTLFYLLVRKVDWGEVFGILSFIALIEIGFILVGGGTFSDEIIPLGWFDIIALILVLFGSYLNSFSELERKWWKKDLTNKGHCYTGGLFKYAMHINYFGDVILFTGWAFLTYHFWTLLVPILMAYMFIVFHIPALDEYLKDRYKDEFDTYASATKKLIPFVY